MLHIIALAFLYGAVSNSLIGADSLAPGPCADDFHAEIIRLESDINKLIGDFEVPETIHNPPEEKEIIKKALESIKAEINNRALKISFSSKAIQTLRDFAILRHELNAQNVDIFNDIIATTITFQTHGKYNVYFLGEELGRGGVGMVSLGRYTDGTLVAVKQFMSTKKAFLEKCKNEYRILEHLKLLHEYCEQKKHSWIFMEYFPGIDPQKLPKNLPIGLINAITSGFLKAVQACHEANVLHGDVKTENFLVIVDCWVSVKLCDFGDACLTTDKIKTNYDGTWPYQPPEAFQKEKAPLSEKFDLYCTGICQFEKMSRYSYLDYLGKRAPGSPYLHKDKIEAFPDMFPDELELAVLRENDPWRYQLILDAQHLSREYAQDRPDKDGVKLMIAVHNHLEDDYLRKHRLQGLKLKRRAKILSLAGLLSKTDHHEATRKIKGLYSPSEGKTSQNNSGSPSPKKAIGK